MAEPGSSRLTLAVLLVSIIAYSAPLSILLLPRAPSVLPPPPPPPPPARKPWPPAESPTVTKIVEALRSRGNYSAAIPDLRAKLAAAVELCRIDGAGEFTVFIPAAHSAYRFCESEKPGARIVMSRVGPDSFVWESGRPTSGSVLQTCGEEPVWVALEKDHMVKGEVVDWNLYDDGRVAVHGFGGEVHPSRPVRTVGFFSMSGLVERRRNPPASFCRSVQPELVDSCSYFRRVGGRWWED